MSFPAGKYMLKITTKNDRITWYSVENSTHILVTLNMYLAVGMLINVKKLIVTYVPYFQVQSAVDSFHWLSNGKELNVICKENKKFSGMYRADVLILV